MLPATVIIVKKNRTTTLLSDKKSSFLGQTRADEPEPKSLLRVKRHGGWGGGWYGGWDEPWMVDRAYNRHSEQWYKYDCRHVPFFEPCKERNGGTFYGYDCFKPADENVRDLHLDDGWHKKLTCKVTSSDDYVVLATSSQGKPVIAGRGSVSKIIRCNDRGKWVTRVDEHTEAEVNDAFCYVVPRTED